MTEVIATNQTILVVGGGISGLTAALEAAETGKQVVLVEKRPFVGGRVTQLYKYFPKLCFPTCGLEINQRRAKMNPNLKIITMAEVTDIKGSAGDYSATIKISPRYINDNCTACGDCARAVEAEFDNEFNYGLGGMKKRKGAYLPHTMAHPQQYVLDPQIVGTADAEKAKAACWLSARETKERLEEDSSLMAEANQALAEAGLVLKNETPVRHMVEVLIEDLGYDTIGSKVIRPLEGIKIAGYIGCQTNRPFGIDGESFENPLYLDKLAETLGADPIKAYDKKVQCCGGALAFSEPEKSQDMIKGIIESAYDSAADMIVTPCPVCQINSRSTRTRSTNVTVPSSTCLWFTTVS